MPTFFWRNLLKCLPTTPLSSSSPFPHEADDNDNTIIRRRTATSPPSIKNLTSSTSADSSSFLFSSSSSSSSSASDPDSPVDFAAISASHRLFFSSPGRSKSITESSENTLPKSPLTGGVAVKKYSPDPYEDFKLSMKEMVEARELRGGSGDVDWAYLHELLSCYLTLNPKNAHKFIISAFADITVTLLASSPKESDNVRPESLQCLRREATPCLLSASWNRSSSRLQPSSS